MRKIINFMVIILCFLITLKAGFANNELENAKELFEIKKQEILRDVKSGKINIKKAKEMIELEKEKIINETKNNIKENNKNEKIKKLILRQISNEINKIEKNSNEKQIKIYEGLLEKLKVKLDNNEIDDNKKMIITIMNDIFYEKINNLK